MPVKYIGSGIPKKIVQLSDILRCAGNTMLENILLGKQVVYIAPATDVVDVFTMPDDRILKQRKKVIGIEKVYILFFNPRK